MLREGAWVLHSESDERWNCHGVGLVGGFVVNLEAKEKLEELKEKYGDPPEDLMYSYTKY